MQKRVIFAGTTGLKKTHIINGFAEYVQRLHGWPSDPRHVLNLCLEDEIPGDFSSFLASDNFPSQLADWSEAMNRILEHVEKQDPDVVFLSLHCMLYAYGELVSFVDPILITKFNPTHIVVLIDDIYEVWARIRQENISRGERFDHNLEELLAWRAAEISQANLLSRLSVVNRVDQSKRRFYRIPTYIVAVKHPKKMLYNLIFKSNARKFYFAMPISSTRDNQEDRYIIDQKIQEAWETRLPDDVIFSPVTIDEWSSPMIKEAAASRENGQKEAFIGFVEGDASMRWPCTLSDTLAESRSSIFPFEIPKSEMLRLNRKIGDLNIVEHQIRRRDYRLIDSIDCIAGYRPNYKKKSSTGMFHEFGYADAHHPRKAIRYFFPTCDESSSHPFRGFLIRYEDEEEWWHALQVIGQ